MKSNLTPSGTRVKTLGVERTIREKGTSNVVTVSEHSANGKRYLNLEQGAHCHCEVQKETQM
ncbi:hypothetical protein KAI37_00800 [Paenibacillus sp. S25]|nr:hypothetical protein KAI37_00800 [Paenibacillus sp. S25]